MRLLIDNSGYDLKNLGDLAMLQVAAERFKEMLPEWDIDIVTFAPDLLQKYCPGTNPVCLNLNGRRTFHGWKMLGRFHSVPFQPLRNMAVVIEEWLRSKSINTTARRLSFRFRTSTFPRDAVREYVQQVERADAIAVSGGGFVTDSFSQHAIDTLNLLSAGRSCGVPTAMFGQGLGPVKEPALLEAARVIGDVDLVALREGNSGPLLLDKLGVPVSKWRITGDDAIELAHECRPDKLGDCLGVNLRLSSYSGILPETARSLFTILSEVAQLKSATVVPVPISFYEEESDLGIVLEFAGISAHEAEVARAIDQPTDVARQAGRCRVVVTGSYHAGVFALSQGASVVGVAATPYYADKFNGLKKQFGEGCTTVVLDGSDDLDRFRQAVTESWERAPEIRLSLLEYATNQIIASRSAYQEWCNSVIERTVSDSARLKVRAVKVG
jgi:polysaccharide pyruvyl transferase WcaK-like protein